MLTKILKTAKFLTGWCSWNLSYPLVATEPGRARLAKIAVWVTKKYPDHMQALREEIEQLMTQIVTGPGGMAPDATEPSEEPEPAIIVEEESAPKDAGATLLGDLKAWSAKRDITGLKDRLGLPKKRS